MVTLSRVQEWMHTIEKVRPVTLHKGVYSFHTEEEGLVKYYPESDVLVVKEKKVITPGLAYIIKNFTKS